MEKRFRITLLVVTASLLLLTLLAQTYNFAFASINQQVATLNSVDLDGPYDGVAGVVYSFTAVASPTDATTPITYVWQAAGETVTHTGGLSDTFTTAWTETGLQNLSVTASNAAGSVSQQRTVSIMPSSERLPLIHGGPVGIYASQPRAIVNTASPSIYGPASCTSFGDPFSPWNSPWAFGEYNYKFLIQIPGDYPFEEVRVELLDPDSINQPANDFTLARTQAAIEAGLSPAILESCTSDQRDPCLIETGELDLAASDALDYEQINPLWFGRLDENRGTGIFGTCGVPAVYTPIYNTRTLYQLYYYRQNDDQSTDLLHLAYYSGQVGDGLRDDGDHQTDMHWVSPGAPPSFDELAIVPADPGSPNSFQINLSEDVPNILTDPKTGDRYLALDIISLDGYSENVFDIWAGPPAYLDNVPSEVNARNLHLLNNPDSHNNYGITIYAMGEFVQNWHLGGQRLEFPFIFLDSDLSGLNFYVSLFDSDAGTSPPITFFSDAIPKNDWSLTFGIAGESDPDGFVRNCTPGNCNNVWVDPPYLGTLPQDFPGGRLMVAYNGGSHDTATWLIRSTGRLFVDGPMSGSTNETYTFTADAVHFLGTDTVSYTWDIEGYEPVTMVDGLSSTIDVSWSTAGPKMITVTAVTGPNIAVNPRQIIVGTHQITIEQPAPPDPNAGCAAFPITVNQDARSATIPGQGGISFPDASDFDYPPDLPADYYNQFINHTPDTPLLNASTGAVFLVHDGSGEGSFSWLVWNEYVNASAATLAGSLAWPGNSQDYATIAPGQTPPGFAHPVYGYIEAGDPTDTEMHIGDWVAAGPGSVNSNGVRNALNSLIVNGRVLRLPVWDVSTAQGSNGRFHISHFALFRIVGYNLDQSQGASWLLLEFMGFDESCGQVGPPAGDAALRIKAVARPADVLVGWIPNRFLEADTYRLLKSADGAPFAEVTVTPNNQYSDSDVDAGSTYCYQAQALDGNMNLIVASEISCVETAP